MAIKVYKPYTPTTRNKSNLDFSILTKIKPEKSLTVANQRAKGRNNQGRITTRHKGGGHKRCYRLIDFKRNKYDGPSRYDHGIQLPGAPGRQSVRPLPSRVAANPRSPDQRNPATAPSQSRHLPGWVRPSVRVRQPASPVRPRPARSPILRVFRVRESRARLVQSDHSRCSGSSPQCWPEWRDGRQMHTCP